MIQSQADIFSKNPANQDTLEPSVKLILLSLSHGAALAIGAALGIYWLHILTEPNAVDLIAVEANQAGVPAYTTRFDLDSAGSDYFHWARETFEFTNPLLLLKESWRQERTIVCALRLVTSRTKQSFWLSKRSHSKLGQSNRPTASHSTTSACWENLHPTI